MAVYVELGTVAERAAKLGSVVSGLYDQESDGGKVKSLSEAVGQENILQLAQLVTDDLNTILSKAPSSSDAEGIFNLLQSFVRNLDNGNTEKLVRKAMDTLTEDTKDNPLLRLKLMTSMFNTYGENATLSFLIFLGILTYATAARYAGTVVAELSKIDTWGGKWALAAEQERARGIYLAAHKLLETLHGQQTKSLAYLMKYLRTFDDAKGNDLAVCKEEAVAAACKALVLPSVYEIDTYLSVSAIAQLKEDPKYASLHDLLHIFAEGNMANFKTFEEKNGDYVTKTFNLNMENLARRLRILCLASLGANNTTVSFRQISVELGVSTDDIVFWVFEAISAGAMEARIDEQLELIYVTWSKRRRFGAEDWKVLQANLHHYQKNLAYYASLLEKGSLQAQVSQQ
mmetsp:Transcript_18011/g.50801  ORF Transcript_18011/g.50801 Transcript_18011/m.50801 type:complete len:401 (+) Transcript_18011:76-1278(+)